MTAVLTDNELRNQTGIYFIRSGDSGPIKIGFSTDIYSRVADLQIGSAEQLHVIGMIPEATRSCEANLHKKFSGIRLMGEWFEPKDDLLKFIRTHSSKPKRCLDKCNATAILKASGLRRTTPSVAVLRWIHREGRPVSHEEAAVALADSAIDKSTIYRCLTRMADAGILVREDYGDHTWRFRLTSNRSAYMLCLGCSALIKWPDFSLPASADGTIESIVLRGTCSSCIDSSSPGV